MLMGVLQEGERIKRMELHRYWGTLKALPNIDSSDCCY